MSDDAFERTARSSARHVWTARWLKWTDRLRGLDFIGNVSATDAGLDPTLSVRYAASGTLHLKEIFRNLPIKSTDTIIDIGCGKGAAIRQMLAYPFARVDGLELSTLLFDIACRNFRRIGSLSARVHIFQGDATTFEGLDRYSHIYLYNPFRESIVRSFIANLNSSLSRKQRSVTVIYNNAICDLAQLSDNRLREVSTLKNEWGGATRIYVS